MDEYSKEIEFFKKYRFYFYSFVIILMLGMFFYFSKQHNIKKENMNILKIQNEVIYHNDISNVDKIKNEKLKNLLLLNFYLKTNNFKKIEKLYIKDDFLLQYQNYILNKNENIDKNNLFYNFTILQKISSNIDEKKSAKEFIERLENINNEELEEIINKFLHVLYVKEALNQKGKK